MSNIGNNTITEYAPGATGNVAPIAVISGGATGLSAPYGLTIDASGNLFASNAGANTITEYAPGATGNVAPIATIAGGSTGLDWPDCSNASTPPGTCLSRTISPESVTEYAPGGNIPGTTGNLADRHHRGGQHRARRSTAWYRCRPRRERVRGQLERHYGA